MGLSGCIQKQQDQYNQNYNNITGTYYGVDLYAYSSNNTNITKTTTTSQEHTMVLICMHTAATKAI